MGVDEKPGKPRLKDRLVLCADGLSPVKPSTSGIALVEACDFEPTTNSRLANLSTRGFVDTGDNFMIGGAIVGNKSTAEVVIRGIGPSLQVNGVPIAGRLTNPNLQLVNEQGTIIAQNDDWQSDPDQARTIRDTGLAPGDPAEAAIGTMLPPGGTTMLLRGKDGGTGVG